MFGISDMTVFGKPVRLWLLFNILSYIVFGVYIFISIIKKQNGKFLCRCSERVSNELSGSEKAKNICLFAEAAIFTLAAVFGSYGMNALFGKCFGPTPNNFFGTVLLAPLLIILLCWIFEIRAMEFTEKIMPAFAVQYCLSNIANFFDGCCAGKYWENGMFNIAAGEKQHPAPLYALAFSLIILFVLIAVRKKSKKVGMCYPLFVFLYSSTRLITQFFRDEDFGKVLSLPIYDFQCIVCTVIGIVLCVIVFLYGSRIEEFLLKNSIGNLRSGKCRRRRESAPKI